ncbi:beta-ketoacyl synthase N-terminal-like domain-containing protein [Pseudomonas aeruginosa]|uniref:polyketide synthase family protein n=1 Tax=Pseudomonas aeruginosa TaxID=287 RepID=UPI001BC94678|nr:beta-ketoacyl synthase N-terminal-like domain-containing protein [Pseudomonas aeruginosa]HCE6901266.1 polyketide synthase [Pseudomonas aeruginosa]HCE6906999.1 polyketide synthase [Pseudomonas aeruginosa]HCE7023848.1 polyketide synthase [Pseudomonas aeruginosa]HCE7068487.1 polyketide synthase [Pseudomonas aeruginosa]HCE7351534.1 polyketide synthase [Pseudomonas aeruginosa]
MTRSHDEAYAISTMAGRFPAAADPEALWDLLCSGGSAPSQSLLPRWQINRESIYSPIPGERDRVYLYHAHCLEDAGALPPPNAGRQLEIGEQVIGRLLEQAGELERQRCALVVATSWSDESFFLASVAPGPADAGHTPAEQIARLAGKHCLGGPALSVDTACSSFPYALDTACGLLHSGQAEQVLVMALNTLMPPALFLGFSQLTALSPRARLQAFGAEADGIVPGECAVAFLVESTSRALAAGRQPLGLLRAIGVSANGAEGSVFAPGEQAQHSAYRRAWNGLDPATASYIESHGTGTPLGDATELASLHGFFGAYVAPGASLPLGSIKSVIGHPLAAAGGPALAKVLLMLRHRSLPPRLDYPCAPGLAKTCLRPVDTRPEPLPERDHAHLIGLSSFGFGGANAHVVIEEYRPRDEPAAMPPAVDPVLRLDLAIVDAEAVLSGAASLSDWQRQLEGTRPALRAFPQGRFGESLAGQPELQGYFLAEERTIDISGYGMGPKPLGHVDPFKLLLADRVGQLLARLPGVAGSDSSALVMCCNMGGERFTNAYSAAERAYRTGAGGGPGIEVADVASMLPCMLSGYPAKLFDLRGFHQTLAGNAGLLWQVLLLAPRWLERGIDTLLLGAGRFMSGALEVQRARASRVMQGEGLGLMALRHYRHDAPQPPLLRLHAALPGDAAGDAGQAGRLLGTATGVSVTVCQLREDRALQEDPMQAATGYLAEASGIATLLQAMLAGAAERLIEVRDGQRVVLWLHAERLARWSQAETSAPAKSPLTLCFAPPAPRQPNAVPAGTPAAPTRRAGQGFDPELLSDTLARTCLASLQLRHRALQALLQAGSPDTPLVADRQWQRQPRNILITAVHRDSPQQLRATLLVDETHPYFFDHPLDHVPGILLLEGILQLLEHALPGICTPEWFVDSLETRFQRYVLKERPVLVELWQSAGAQRYHARITQDGQSMCTCELSVARAPRQTAAGRFAREAPCTRREWLHKAREENVLVGDIDRQARVRTLPVPAGQFFEDGHRQYHSMVYFLEVARQAYMQIAHGILAIPCGTPMNLLILSFRLDSPLLRDQPLTLAPKDGPGDLVAGKTKRIVIELRAAGQLLGEARLTAQVLDEEARPVQPADEVDA